jgi:hypothetical protein
MTVHGADCRLTIKTTDREIALPYSEETIRENVCLLTEEASIEGDGNRRAIRKSTGTTGCIVTPLTIGTVPLLWTVALGEREGPVFVSETRNLYKHVLHLVPHENSPAITIIRGRGTERIGFEHCRVSGFELRIVRNGTTDCPGVLHLRLDISGEVKPEPYPVETTVGLENAERFKETGVRYTVNGVENNNIYGLTITATKQGGTKTEIRLHRILSEELGNVIDQVTITARLFRDCYEWRRPGTFRLTLTRLLLMADETSIDSPGAVIGPLRYYVAGTMTAEVFTNTEDTIL